MKIRTILESKINLYLIFGLFLALSIVAYLPAIQGEFIWDDDNYIINNETLRSFDGLKTIWTGFRVQQQYYPLTLSTFWVEYNYFWHLNPLGYHIVNVILHACNAFILWIILKSLQIRGAWFAAAVFALHPVHVESVAWITERKNVLSAFFYLLSLGTYIKFSNSSFIATRKGSSPNQLSFMDIALYIASFILYLFALLSKTVTSSLPAAILLILWWKNKRIRLQDIVLLSPYFIVGVFLGLNTAWLEKHNVGAQGFEWGFSFIERCLIAGRALWFYASKLIWPFNLSFNYPRWNIEVGVWWQYVFPLAAIVVLFSLWFLRKRIGRGPFVTISLFAGTLFPALGFVDVYPMRYSFVADHFQYLASIGLLVAACSFLSGLFAKTNLKNSLLNPIFCISILIILGTLTWQQGHIYKNLETLWRDTISKNPESFLAHNNMGTILAQKGNYKEAFLHFKKFKEINPTDKEANYNLGVLFFSIGKFKEAQFYFRETLKLDSTHHDAQNYLKLLD